MAKNNETTKREKAAIVVRVLALAVLALTALYMTGLLNIGEFTAQVLGYGLTVVTVYFALSIVK